MPNEQFDYNKLSDKALIELKESNHDYNKVSDETLMELKGARIQAPTQPMKYESETPTLDTIKDVAGRYAVPEETLRKRAAGLGMPAEDAGLLEKGLSKVTGVVSEGILGGFPNFVAKKMEDEHTERAIDELNDKLQQQKTGVQKVAEVAAGFTPLGQATKGLGLAAKAGRNLAEGVGMSAVSGLSHSKTGHELEGAVDTVKSAAPIMLGLTGVGAAGKYGADKLARKGEDLAAQKAVDVFKPTKTDRVDLGKKFGSEEAFGKEALAKKFDFGDGKPRALVEFGDSVENVLEKSSTARANLGPKIGAAAKQHPDVMVDTGKYIQNWRNKVNEDFGNVTGLEDVHEGLLKKIDNAEKRYVQVDDAGNVIGYKQIPFEEAYQQRVALDDFLRKKKAFTSDAATAQMLRDQRDVWDDVIMDSLPTADKGALGALKRDYSIIKSAEELAKSGALKQRNNQTFSPSSKLFGALQAGADVLPGGKLMSVPVAIANQTLLNRGPAMTAVTLDKLSKKIRENPLAFGRFGSMLRSAAIRGTANLQALHERLTQTDPEYSATLQQELGGD